MSKEARVHSSIVYMNGGRAIRELKTFDVDVASAIMSSGVIDLTTTAELVPMGEVADPGLAWFYNAGSDTIKIAAGLAGDPVLELAAGEGFAVRLTTTEPSAVAESTTSRLEFTILSN